MNIIFNKDESPEELVKKITEAQSEEEKLNVFNTILTLFCTKSGVDTLYFTSDIALTPKPYDMWKDGSNTKNKEWGEVLYLIYNTDSDFYNLLHKIWKKDFEEKEKKERLGCAPLLAIILLIILLNI